MTRALGACGLGMRVAVACGLLLMLGCDELGNPSTGVVFDDHGVQLRSQMRTAPAEAAENLTAGLPQDALDYADDQAPIGGYVALVRVDITGLPEQPGSDFLLETVFALGNGQRVARRWTADGGSSTHLALFALPDRPLQLVTHLPKL